jgi:hypothetical protein
VTLKANVADRAFNTSTGQLNYEGDVTSMACGVAVSGTSGATQARIDLTITQFKVADLIAFSETGSRVKSNILDGGFDGQRVMLLGGGKCGGIHPGTTPVSKPQHMVFQALLLQLGMLKYVC